MSVPIWTACEIWNKEGKIPSCLRRVEGYARPAAASAPSSVSANTNNSTRAHTRTHTDALGGTSGRQKLADTLVQTPISIFSFFLCSLFALPFSPGRFRVPQMCHQTLVSIWTWGKKEILDRKLYKKRTLWIFDILRTAASKWVGWRGKEKQLQDRFLFICCLFSLSPFREMEASTRPQLTHPCIQGLSAGPWKENWHS